MKRIRRPLLTAPLAAGLLAAAVAAGCASKPTAASPVGVTYSHGGLVAIEAAPQDAVWRALLAALESLDLVVLDSVSSALGSRLEAKTPELQTVRAQTKTLGAGKTELRIRIATFGDEALSQLIYEKLQLALDPAK